LKEIVTSKKWEENLDAITKARELVLNEYQLFPFLYNQIKALESIKESYSSLKKEEVHFRGGNDYFDNYPITVGIEKQSQKMVNRFIKLFK
jgi:hypothetical protein